MNRIVFLALALLSVSEALIADTEVQLLAKELLGRPSESSVTVNALADTDLDVYFEYGTAPGVYSGQTQTAEFNAGQPIEVVLDGLQPDTRYYYRMRYRPTGSTEPYIVRPEHTFHTQRSPENQFIFTIQADSHLYDGKCNPRLYEIALQNALEDSPDFHIDLGDTFGADKLLEHGTESYEAIAQRHLDQRSFFGLIAHSAPLFLVLGNHEGECAAYMNGTADNIAIWATRARQLYYPNPFPTDFYSGNTESEEFVGLPENYYSWEWGGALFVVLDAYRYLTTDPKPSDHWEWTLGKDQYLWFKNTLETSDAKLKFVFAHHVLGQTRGAVKWASLYEWGGRDRNGNWQFDIKRPGWHKPIHQVMVENEVTIYFQGHDHVYAKEELDGVVYQEVPMPSDATYNVGKENEDDYPAGIVFSNSGHLRVTVSPPGVQVDYVTAYLPEDETISQRNGQVTYSYAMMSPCSADAECDDDLFCNGIETCSDGVCRTGSDPCFGLTCDEGLNQCTESGTGEQKQPDLIFVQYVDGGSLSQPNSTRVILANPTPQECSGELRFKDDSGKPSPVSIQGNPVDTLNFSLKPWGTFEVETDGTGSLQTGIIEAFTHPKQENETSVSLAGSEIFNLLGHSVSVGSSIPSKEQQVYVSFSPEENTGVAIYNPDPVNAIQIDLILKDKRGVEQSRLQFTLGPGQRRIGFVDQTGWFEDFFATQAEDFQGTLDVVVKGSGRIASLGLLQIRATGALVAVPVEQILQ